MKTHPLILSAAVFAVGVMVPGLSACSSGPKYPNCNNDQDCQVRDEKAGRPGNEYCVNKMCQQCRNNIDCGAGNRCMQGRCETIPGYCRTKQECGLNQDCQGNKCVTVVSTAPEVTPDTTANQESSACDLQTVYFEFDSDMLAETARSALQGDAKCIRDRNIKAVQVTGYTDPRGTEEYNLALGDRRARSTAQYLKSLGVENGKINTSSVGEEMSQGTDESSWAKDRKVELKAR